MEYWDIYDKDGHFTGRKKGKYEKWGEDEYHLATEGWIINSNKQILVQQRSNKCQLLRKHKRRLCKRIQRRIRNSYR